MTRMSNDEIFQAISEAAIKVLEGDIAYEKVLEQLDIRTIGDALSDELIVAVSRQALKFATARDPQWQAAIALQTLLYECVDVRDDPPPISVIGELAWNYMSAASRALWFVPDPSLYKRATERGTAAVELLRAQGNLRAVGDLLHALGTMNLDPYGANRPSGMFREIMSAWRARAANGETWNHVTYFDLEADGYPNIEDALAAAARYYREAASLREGRDRAMSLKALAQTHANSFAHDLPCDKGEAAEAASEALKSLDQQQDPAVYSETLNYLKLFSDDTDDVRAVVPADWLAGSIDRSVQQLGVDQTIQLLEYAYNSVDDYARLLRMQLDAAPLFKDSDFEPVYHTEVIRTFVRSCGAKTYDLQNPPEESIETLYEKAVTAAEEEAWDPARLSATLLALADVSVVLDKEAVGVQLLDIANKAAPFSIAAVSDSLAYFRAQLLTNDAVNAVNRKDWNESTRLYAEGLAAWLDAGAGKGIQNFLHRLADVVKRGDAAAALAVCSLLEEKIDSIEVVVGDRVTASVQDVLNLAARRQLVDKPDTSVLWRLMQLSSARRFAAMLAAGSAYQVDPEQVGQKILTKIHELRERISQQEHADTVGDRLGNAVLLSPYEVHATRMSGGTATEQLANVEHQFDGLVYNALLSTAQGQGGILAKEIDVRATLGAADVLIQYYEVDASEDGQVPANLVSAITTREETIWRAVQFGNNPPRAKMVIDGVAVEITQLSAMVQSIRDHIEEDPQSDVLSADTADAIASLSGLVMEPLQEQLERLHRAGKRHLCIVPPGPLAYIPFHILGDKPGALMESWTISYLPTIQLLVRNYGAPALLRQRNTSVVAFGVSFEGNTLGYYELPEAVSEAKAVADTMGSAPMLEGDATETNVLEALLNSQYVHIATHGHQNPIAPCFHKLVLTPDVDDDGALHAYELLGRDLRGLKLVTLSACETALGRFDRGNNPHGLPATLLLAGAQTVIGTLWAIESACSERFFTTLYMSLSDGQTKLDAYNEALRTARQHHPQFRDWGAFYFLGDWN